MDTYPYNASLEDLKDSLVVWSSLYFSNALWVGQKIIVSKQTNAMEAHEKTLTILCYNNKTLKGIHQNASIFKHGDWRISKHPYDFSNAVHVL